jgi:hypothetical protein
MVFPTLKAGQEATRFLAAGVLTNTITLPVPATPGNVLVLCGGGDKNSGALTVTDDGAGLGGWHVPVAARSTSVSLSIAWKPAEGGEQIVTFAVGANAAGGQWWLGEYEQIGAGVWHLRALAVHASDESTVTAWSSGTTSAAAGDGRAIAAFAVDSVLTAGTPTYTGGYVSEQAPGNGGSEAGLWVASAPVSSGATTETTLTRGGATADQMAGGVVVLGRAATAGTRINLQPRPACGTSATGWFGPSGWARSTSVTSLERTTGFAGIAAGDVITPKFVAVAGAPYVGSVEVHAVAAQTATISIDWYDAAGVFVTGSGDGVPWTAAAGAVLRPEVGPVVCPSGATRGLIVLNGLDGAAEVTAALTEQTTETGRPYFDGDTAGASWAGTPGNSASYLLTGSDAFTVADSGSMVATAPGPVGGDTLRFAESAAVVATGGAVDEFAFSESALILALAYDDERGRIRVDALGLPVTAIRAEVYARPVSTARYILVRGGQVTVADGRFLRPVDDYEFVAGAAMVYKVIALSSDENQPDVVVAEATVTRPADPLTHVWLKFIAMPVLNRKLKLTGWGEISRPSRNVAYDVVGRSEPVVVTDVHGSRRVPISVRTADLEETAALDEALSLGMAIFLHTPVTTALPSLYAVVGNYSYERPSMRSVAARWTIPLIEVAAPPPSVVPAGSTYQTVLDQFVTYQELLDAYDTYRDVAS